ncbi:hypothetical protein IV500_03330 [Paeniglutamicibacter antarcticus]|uniref:Uncharacterized protein n=1 Tax=Arthrobacter terrae TaxID=2935737 RepID=A0A931G4I7_9MICC|nr:hypothetical protein [Arthrobacter terrae]MBG0738460.1 hypothetical protein [Arthrobacter terrae]
MAAAALVPELGQPQSSSDVLPAVLQANLGHDRINPATTRLLGKFGQLSYFVATDEKGRLCLFPVGSQGILTGPVCIDVTSFAVKGLQLTTADPIQSVWLVPPASSLPDPTWTVISGNLYRQSAR